MRLACCESWRLTLKLGPSALWALCLLVAHMWVWSPLGARASCLLAFRKTEFSAKRTSCARYRHILPPFQTEGVVCCSCLTYARRPRFQAVLAWHRAGFLHLDIKPGNVAIDSKGDVVILDAGISRRLQDGSLAVEVRGPIGTQGFMAPELSKLGHGEHKVEATAACDVYSLGATLREALKYVPQDSEVATVRPHQRHHFRVPQLF